MAGQTADDLRRPRAVIAALLDEEPRARAAAQEVRDKLDPKKPGHFGERVAEMLKPWLV